MHIVESLAWYWYCHISIYWCCNILIVILQHDPGNIATLLFCHLDSERLILAAYCKITSVILILTLILILTRKYCNIVILSPWQGILQYCNCYHLDSERLILAAYCKITSVILILTLILILTRKYCNIVILSPWQGILQYCNCYHLDSERLILAPSLSLSPVAPVLSTRSLDKIQM